MAVKEREPEVVAASAAEGDAAGHGAGTWLPHPSGPDGWTARDLASFPDDGLRYELLDGMVIVSPSPMVPHQFLSSEINELLRSACPNNCAVLYAPLDWRPSETRVFQPDLLVVRRDDAAGKYLTGTPVLLVEIASPSTAAYDRGMKFRAYAEAGVPQYWIVEPGATEDGSDVTVEVYDLVDEEYVLQGKAHGDQALDVTGPVPVRVVPAELVR